ncbi:MAG: cell division protein FtsL [Myxococcota bacterium]|nr:cell division protein FtsL [Myxococcota bacterium]MDW8362531.1 cell division protein FtsL [Myxococcales bacterium]
MSPRRRFLALWTAAVVAATCAFVVHLALRFETVRLGYAVGEARRAQRQWLDRHRWLTVEAASLRAPARIEAIARPLLGMDAPPVHDVVVVREGGGGVPRGRLR